MTDIKPNKELVDLIERRLNELAAEQFWRVMDETRAPAAPGGLADIINGTDEGD